jgi:arginyl-tRNA synthetase
MLEPALKQQIAEAFEQEFGLVLHAPDIALQPTKKEFAGQYTLVTFPYTKSLQKSPEQIAEIIGRHLARRGDPVGRFNAVKGFLNLEISRTTWVGLMAAIAGNDGWGRLPEKGEHVVVEYSSPNTNKPLHLGHLRNNFLGYATSQVLKAAGYRVTMVNLVNDRGIHICKSMLAYSKLGQGETPASSGLKGDHLIGKYYVLFDREYKKQVSELSSGEMPEEAAAREAPWMLEAQQMLQAWENHDPEVLALWHRMNNWVYEGFDATYRRIGVSFDKIYRESETYLLGKEIVAEGLEIGIFERREDGSVWVDLAGAGMDQKLLLRSDGTSVYITQDLGTADLKYHDFRCDRSVYVVGNEQDYHFEVLFHILARLGRSYANGLYHLSYGMVDLPSGKMKSREGTVVDADDLLDEMHATARNHTEELGKIEGLDALQARELYEMLALGALKYFLLKVDPRKRMLFNPEESIQFHGNTGPFIQYTHARIAAVLRKAAESDIHWDDCDFGQVGDLHETEIAVLNWLHRFPQYIAEAAAQYAPSVIAQYVYELAREYNRFYTEVTILGEADSNRKKFKLVFSSQVARTIKMAMRLLGIDVPERM